MHRGGAIVEKSACFSLVVLRENRTLSMKLLKALLPLLCCILCTSTPAAQKGKSGSDELIINARMVRYPDVSETHIAFVYGGDIWIVPKTGGSAQRLSSPRGEETFPRFSPDGNSIAFSGNYDGNMDV